jgi:polyisoprenoid-binding protein YceI
MNMKPFPYASLLLIMLSTLAMSSLFQSWTITNDYQVRFSGTGAIGNFRGLEGDIQFNPTDLNESRMDVRVAVATIDTGNKTKDRHARGASWFDAEQYPHIRFVSSSFRQTKAGYVVEGKLTLRGVTKAIRIPFAFEDATAGKVFNGKFTVNRHDYGIEGPWLAALTVGDEFTIQLRVSVTPQ